MKHLQHLVVYLPIEAVLKQKYSTNCGTGCVCLLCNKSYSSSQKCTYLGCLDAKICVHVQKLHHTGLVCQDAEPAPSSTMRSMSMRELVNTASLEGELSLGVFLGSLVLFKVR